VTVEIGKVSLATIELQRERPVVLHLPKPRLATGPVRLRFSNRVRSTDGRSLAFQVVDTNLFSERDVA
jgi:hypothetical protein